MLSEYEFNIRVAEALTKWRKEAGMTQEEVARKLECTRRTVVSLESGEKNLKLYTVFQWAEITKHTVEKIAAEVRGVKYSGDLAKIIDLLIGRAQTFKPDEARGVFFIFFGDHKSDLRAFIHLCVAYLQCPMRDKQNITLQIINNYRNALQRGEIVQPDDFQPDLDFLAHAQEQGRQAFVNDVDTYDIKIGGEEHGI